MIFPILGLFLGLVLGFLSPVLVPFALAKYFSVAILAALDAVFGGLRAGAYDKFDNEVFVTGFFSNALMAAFLVFLGDKLGIDLYYVALLAFGFRIFKNLALLRRWILKKHPSER
ncbi:small basic family protein [uncultured Selenomonas sp.]|uniref:small basic family protein n=1 Tax=uncultured Selenomonas sp. TaxID=159275 RepID=UPI0025F58351|nr:small basic family protein [uncultured Selenomonas sp.]